MLFCLLLISLLVLVYYLYHHTNHLDQYKPAPEQFYHHYEADGPIVDTFAKNEKIMRPLDIKSCTTGYCNPYNMSIDEAIVARIEGPSNLRNY